MTDTIGTDRTEQAALLIVGFITMWADNDGAPILRTARNLSNQQHGVIAEMLNTLILPSDSFDCFATAAITRANEIISTKANNETNQTEKST